MSAVQFALKQRQGVLGLAERPKELAGLEIGRPPGVAVVDRQVEVGPGAERRRDVAQLDFEIRILERLGDLGRRQVDDQGVEDVRDLPAVHLAVAALDRQVFVAQRNPEQVAVVTAVAVLGGRLDRFVDRFEDLGVAVAGLAGLQDGVEQYIVVVLVCVDPLGEVPVAISEFVPDEVAAHVGVSRDVPDVGGRQFVQEIGQGLDLT